MHFAIRGQPSGAVYLSLKQGPQFETGSLTDLELANRLSSVLRDPRDVLPSTSVCWEHPSLCPGLCILNTSTLLNQLSTSSMVQVLYIYESNLIAKKYCLFVQKCGETTLILKDYVLFLFMDL